MAAQLLSAAYPDPVPGAAIQTGFTRLLEGAPCRPRDLLPASCRPRRPRLQRRPPLASRLATAVAACVGTAPRTLQSSTAQPSAPQQPHSPQAAPRRCRGGLFCVGLCGCAAAAWSSPGGNPPRRLAETRPPAAASAARRWQRAQTLGLSPPQNVYDFLLSDEGATHSQCIWEGRL